VINLFYVIAPLLGPARAIYIHPTTLPSPDPDEGCHPDDPPEDRPRRPDPHLAVGLLPGQELVPIPVLLVLGLVEPVSGQVLGLPAPVDDALDAHQQAQEPG